MADQYRVADVMDTELLTVVQQARADARVIGADRLVLAQMRAIALALIIATVLAVSPVAAAQPVEDCDRLASHPDDLQRIAPGVPFEQIDTQRALAACAAALRAEPRNWRSQYHYGRVLVALGRGQEALRHLEAAGEGGYAMAQELLGKLFFRGRLVPRDYVKARDWLQRSAVHGIAWTQNLLGYIYLAGLGTPPDATLGVQWVRAAAQQGMPAAMNYLGLLYLQGTGVAQDYAEAAKWFQAALDKGEVGAINGLGALYLGGLGVAKDPARAIALFERAAAQDNVDGHINLGKVFSQNMGVPVDKARAAKHFRRAAALGSDEAKALLAGLGETRAGAAKPATGTGPAVAEAAPPKPARDLVAKVQGALAALGYDPGPADGLIGARTRASVRAFEHDSGQRETGRVDLELYETLVKVATRAEAAPPEPAPEPSALAFESPESTDDTESEKALADGAGGAFPGAARDSGSAFPGAMDE